MLDMAVLLDESGYAAMPGPFLFSSALAASALAHGGSDEIKERWLGALADGTAIGTVAITERNDTLDPAEMATSARRDGAGWVLNGTKMFVPYAHVADFIVVVARTGSSPADIRLFVVETRRARRDASGCSKDSTSRAASARSISTRCRDGRRRN